MATYAEVLAMLEDGLTLARQLGLDDELETTRLVTYRDDLRGLIDFVALHRAGRLTPDIVANVARRKAEYVAALSESVQFGAVARELAGSDPKVLRPKFRDALRGPALPSDEDANSNHARNTLFELALAARLHRAGLTPMLGDRPDVCCVVDDTTMAFECKRMFSEKKLAERIAEAGDRLREDLTAAGPGAGVGVIATASALNFLKGTGTLPQNVSWAVKGAFAVPLFDAPPPSPRITDRGAVVCRAVKATCSVTASAEPN